MSIVCLCECRGTPQGAGCFPVPSMKGFDTLGQTLDLEVEHLTLRSLHSLGRGTFNRVPFRSLRLEMKTSAGQGPRRRTYSVYVSRRVRSNALVFAKVSFYWNLLS